jgi:hypothetical protein
MAQKPPSNILAVSTFSQPDTSNMAVSDIYDTKNPGVVNSIQDQVDKEDSSLKSYAIRGSKFLKSLLPTVGTVLSDGTSILKATSGKQRLALLMNSSSRVFQSLPDNYKSLITSDPKTLGSSIVTVGGVTQKVLNTNYGNIQSTARLVGDLTGDSNLVGVQDPDSMLAMTSGIAKEASRTRVPGTFGALVSTMNNSTLVNKFAKMTLPTTLEYSDSLGLKDLATMTKPGDVNLMNPNLAKDFSTVYTSPPSCTAADNKAEYTNVMDAFNTVNSDWDKTKRQYDVQPSTDITPLMGSSDDMQKMLKAGYMDSNNIDKEVYSFSTVFSSESVDSNLANKYSGTARTSTTTTRTPSYF